jgi:Dyp-type peroxidase family
MLDLENIQGNILAGFNKDHERLLFIGFPQGSEAKAWLREIEPDVASTAEVDAFNRLFKETRRRHGHEHSVKATWMNVALSASGLKALGVADADLNAFSPSFQHGMKAKSSELGDTGVNDPSTWVKPLGSPDVHALLIIAADDRSDLDAATLRHIQKLSDHGLVLLFDQYGKVRPDLPGHEHFGFKDGISQPGVRDFTPAGANPNEGQPGQPLLYAGEFVLGYPGQQPPPAPPTPIPGPPNYEPAPNTQPPQPTTSTVPTEPGPVVLDGPEWAKDGSYLVFRRLRQDVAGFAEYLSKTAAAAGAQPSLLGAKLVGRYQSGCPLERTRDEAADLDTSIADPSIKEPSLLEDAKVNNFGYASDTDGGILPRAAHIRKTYPRDEETPGGGAADTETHRILRRGIPYGEPYESGAQPGSRHAGDAEFPNDRGLLFLCYQSSIERQFEVVQSVWANNPNFPRPGDGEDPIIAQSKEPRTLAAPNLPGSPLTIKQFVTTTGGEYFFAPSISALATLSQLP